MTTTAHAAEAREFADVNQEAEFAMQAYALAQVHATLALAAEQRTANLIAYVDHTPPHSHTRDRLLDEIHARLDPAIDEDVTA